MWGKWGREKSPGGASPQPVTAIAKTEPAPAAAPAAEIGAGEAELIRLLEADIRRAQGKLAGSGAAMRAAAAEGVRGIERIRGDSDHMAGETTFAQETAAGLARTISAFAETAGEIGRQAQSSGQLAGAAEAATREVTAATAELHTAIREIQAVVSIIDDIARQTNLLALNASIEAARAGVAGAGFAVVASEVKALATETQKATRDIGAKIERLEAAARTSDGAVERVGATIAEIRPVAARVADAVAGQVAGIDAIARGAADVQHFAQEVAARAQSIRDASIAATATGTEIARSTEAVTGGVDEMSRHLLSVLRQTPMGDRRRFERWPVEISGTLAVSGAAVPAKTLDLSQGGVLLAALSPAPRVGSRGELTLSGLGRLPCRVVGVSELGCHLAFEQTDLPAVSARIAALATASATLIDRAVAGARAVTSALEAGLKDGRITREHLFDTDYKVLPGTDPEQVETRALRFLEAVLPALQEPILSQDPNLVFCVAVDINGYLPVHNAKFAQPQRPGDPAWNNANARNRRIFDDRAGLLAARNTKPHLVQVYARHIGGQVIMMKEVDASIVIDGRHWGGFRTCYRL